MEKEDIQVCHAIPVELELVFTVWFLSTGQSTEFWTFVLVFQDPQFVA